MKIYSFSKKVPPYLASPFIDFENSLDLFHPDVRILELGTGSGGASGHLINNFNNVTYSDVDPENTFRFNRFFKDNLNISCSEIDVEKIPFPDNTFDVIVAVGLLSYCNKHIALSEIKRTLKIGGHILILDSINSQNIFFKIHRYIKIVRGIHTFRYKNMLDSNFLKYMNYIFFEEKLNYYGSMYFMIPMLRKLAISNKAITNFCNYFDQIKYSKNFAFKIFFHGRKL